MKRTKCCSNCRRRHRKCVIQPGATKCGGCLEAGKECRFEPEIRFKHTRAHDPRGPQPTRESRPSAPRSISFVTPRGVGTEFSDASAQASGSVARNGPLSQDGGETRPDGASTGAGIRTPQSGVEVDQMQLTTNALQQHPTITNVQHVQTPDSIQPAINTPDSHGYRPEQPAKLTERQAFLFMTYIHKLAPSSDACDEARHFTLEVPRLALTNPMIMNGVLALASAYDALCTGVISDLESTYYHNQCLELLIKAIAKPSETWDSKLLAAVVIARLYEEYDNEKDSNYHHLSGTQNLLNHEAVAVFATQGGLAEAASWVHLRQAIYVYLVRREPIDIRLESFERSTVFQRTDDSAYANRIVYLFAKLIKFMIPIDGPQDERGPHQERWKDLEDDVARWNESKPLSFSPIHSRDADSEDGRPFPAIYIAASVPVVAMQHYYAARAVICLHETNKGSPNVGYQAARRRRDGEQRIATYLGILMGLALSNEHAINAFYLPCHMLSLCGFCIRDPVERSSTIQYLQKANMVLKWKTRSLAEMLESQWKEMDGLEKRN